MKRERYEKIRSRLEEKPGRLACLRLLYRVLPPVVAAGYAVCLALSAAASRKLLVCNLVVPAAVFALVTVFRAAVDLPRPYEVWKLPPLVPKDKRGHSFPSRHAASAGVIAMAWWQVSVPAGALFLLIAAGIAASRVLAGVHFVRDVAAGLALGVGAGVLAIMLGG
ncbi:MAG: phosphatase PAP2 family protein [Lachnospiraceae bacterium]|nr:phosphatase PAP2 family protein [Lachnospiraceae bacterium]